MIIIAVIYIALYLTNKGEHTTLYKINNNIYIKTFKKNYIIIWYSLHTHTHMHTDAHTHTHAHTHTQ